MKMEIVALEPGTSYPYPMNFTWVLILVCLLAIQYMITMYAFTMRMRLKCFTPAFMKNFEAEHKEAFPERPTPPKFGYPDAGCGRYGKALPYGDWYDMNNGQRAQINFLEQITFIIGISLIAALQQDCTWYAMGFLAAYSIGRFIFSMGYTALGPNARVPGAILMDLAILGQLILSFVSVAKLW